MGSRDKSRALDFQNTAVRVESTIVRAGHARNDACKGLVRNVIGIGQIFDSGFKPSGSETDILMGNGSNVKPHNKSLLGNNTCS
jgi:hypothetical protein